MTRQQKACLDAIRRLTRDGVPPSLEELRVELGLAAKSGVHRLLKQLEEQGHIRRRFAQVRAIELVDRTATSARAALIACDRAHEAGRRVTLEELHQAISGVLG